MNLYKLKRVVPVGAALAIAVTFIFLVLSPGGCAFNLLPYALICKRDVDENSFIRGFDIVFAFGLFFLFYYVIKSIMNATKKP